MKKIVIRGLAAMLVAFALVACTTAEPEPEPDVVSTFEFALSYANAVPINVFPSTGKGTAKVTLNETKKTVSVEGTYSDMSAPVSAAHIHFGAKGATGDVVVPLVVEAAVNPTAISIEISGKLSLESTTLTDQQIADMKSGNHYINVHTENANPAGEIRGQISNDDADTIVTYVTELSALNSVPPNASTGVGKSVATLNTTTGMAMLVGNYSGLTGPALFAHIHVGAKGATGDVVIPLTLVDNIEAPGSGVFGFPATAVTAAQVAGLQGGQFYINIHTEANPGGEIRGQIE